MLSRLFHYKVAIESLNQSKPNLIVIKSFVHQ